MRGALVHAILLAVMLVYGYRTWTRDKTVEPNIGTVVLWDKPEAQLVSLEYKSKNKVVKLEKKPEGYWWGEDTTIVTRAKPQPAKAAGSGAGSGSAGSGSAGSAGSATKESGSGSGSGAKDKEPDYEIVSQNTHQFPTGDGADKLLKAFSAARALRDLGKPSDAQRKDYKLDEEKSQIIVTFTDGAHTFDIGGTVYGGAGDRYAVDEQTGKAYVLSREMVSPLELGESSLHLVDPRGFDLAKVAKVTIAAGGRSKTVARITANVEGHDVKTWGDPGSNKANQTVANFVDNVANLRPTEYDPDLKVSELTPVMKLTYVDDRGDTLGTLSMYKHEKPGTLPPGQELDPANPPKGEIEYLIVTEKTRVPAVVRKDTAERSEQDIETVFSGKPAAPSAGSGAGSAAMGKTMKLGEGSAAKPAEGSAAKPAAGSAAKPAAGSAAKPAEKPATNAAPKPAAKPAAAPAAKPAAAPTAAPAHAP